MGTHLQPTEVMVSFDIKSLFTNVPIDEALRVIEQKLLEDETLEDRTALSVKQITRRLPADNIFHLSGRVLQAEGWSRDGISDVFV